MSKARDIVETLRTVLVDGDVTNANFTGADLDIAKGGTGASTAGAARTALGLAIGSDVQAFDSAIMVDGDIGTTVQAHDANTAKLDEAANFTGTLQNSGSNVIVDSDIGTTVLAPNGSGANLTGIETSSTLGTLTKSFLANESSEITLSSTVSPTPAVGVTKEVAQVGVSSKGSWDVVSTGDNYDLQNTATAVTLTPSSATANGTFSLGSGSFAAADVGKKITGNSGEAILTSTAGAYSIVTSFANTNAIASGSWQMYALKFDSANGITFNSVIQGYAISSTAYNSKNFNGGAIGAVHLGIFFKPDGLSMYHVSNANTMYQWALSTAWDISTLSYNSKSFNVTAQDSHPQDVFFSPDGTKMFMLGKSDDRVYAYTLSTAWDISTMSYASAYFDVANSGQETTPHSLQFKPDGTKMYVAGESSNKMHQYSLSTAWDVTTASYDSVYFANTAQNSTQLLCTVFSTDGTKLFALNENGQKMVFKYNLSTAWNIGTASYANESFLLSSQDNTPTAIAFKDDGTRMYMVGTTTNTFFQYTTESVFAPAAKYHPAITKDSGQINSTYWTDINTMTTDQINGNGTVSYAVSTDNRTIWKTAKNGVGIRSIAKNNSGTWQYNSAFVSTPYDIENAAYDSKSFSVSSQAATPEGLFLKPDGTKLYVCSNNSDAVFQYTLSTAWDISTASYNSVTISVGSVVVSPAGITFSADGTKMYLVDAYNEKVFQYTLSTAWDLSTASYANLFISIASQNIQSVEVLLNNNGTKMYMAGSAGNSIYQYALSTAYNISTASYESKSFSFASQEGLLSGVTFNADGTKMFAIGTTNDSVYAYTLSTAFDVSTASYDSVSFSVASQELTPRGIVFKTDGSKLYVLGDTADTVFQYTTTSQGFTTSETWVNGTTNTELATIQQSLNATAANVMLEEQLEAVTDPNHFALGTTLDLMIAPYMATASASLPSSDGVSINYDAAALNKGAILGTDYDYDFPANNKVRITSLASQNLKVRVV